MARLVGESMAIDQAVTEEQKLSEPAITPGAPSSVPAPSSEPATPSPKSRGKTPAAATPPALSDDELFSQWDKRVRENDGFRDRLKSHDVVNGFAGTIAERIRNQQLQEDRTKAAAEAVTSEQARMLKLAEDDPEQFAELFRTKTQADAAREQIEHLQLEARKAEASKLGRAFADLPEFKTAPITTEELAQLSQRLVGVSDENASATYATAMTDLLANRRGRTIADRELTERLKAEIEAHDTQAVGARQRATTAPDLRRGATVTNDGQPDFKTDPIGYRDYFNRKYGQGR